MVSTASREGVNSEWVMEALRSGGYDASRGGKDPETIIGKHAGRPNMAVRVHPELGLITLTSFWHLKKTGFGSHKDLLEKMNTANSESWRDTFYVDRDGDLAVSSYITIAGQMSANDVTKFLEDESQGFTLVVQKSGLIEHVQ